MRVALKTAALAAAVLVALHSGVRGDSSRERSSDAELFSVFLPRQLPCVVPGSPRVAWPALPAAQGLRTEERGRRAPGGPGWFGAMAGGAGFGGSVRGTRPRAPAPRPGTQPLRPPSRPGILLRTVCAGGGGRSVARTGLPLLSSPLPPRALQASWVGLPPGGWWSWTRRGRPNPEDAGPGSARAAAPISGRSVGCGRRPGAALRPGAVGAPGRLGARANESRSARLRAARSRRGHGPPGVGPGVEAGAGPSGAGRVKGRAVSSPGQRAPGVAPAPGVGGERSRSAVRVRGGPQKWWAGPKGPSRLACLLPEVSAGGLRGLPVRSSWRSRVKPPAVPASLTPHSLS